MTDGTSHSTEESPSSWVFHAGNWSTTADPLTHVEGGSFDDAVKAASAGPGPERYTTCR